MLPVQVRLCLLAFLALIVMVYPLHGQPHRDDYDLFETEYNWLEIEDLGQPLIDLHDNDFQGPFDIGFRFPFYGEIYEQFWISSNGFIGFGPTDRYSSFENEQLPNEADPDNIISVYWKDLDPEAFWANGAVYYGMRNDRRVIQYQGYAERNPDGREPDNTITMQIVLKPDGDIIFQYAQVGEEFDLADGTVGIESREGLAGITLRHDGEGIPIEDGAAYLISEHGPGEFLVWDGGRSYLSGDVQERVLEDLDHTVTRLKLSFGQQLPEDLREYEAVFINLGNFGVNGNNYHALTAAEGRIIADYLEAGGSVYMEGSDTWSHDPVTAAHPYFCISGVNDGGPLEPPVTGVDGSFGEDLTYNAYQAIDNDFVDHLEALNGAEEIMSFREDENEFLGMVACRNADYRTVGCSFEMGALVDGDEGTKQELIVRILEFFWSPPPEFPAPVNLQAMAGDGEVTLSWDMPRRPAPGQQRIEAVHREIIRLSQPKNGEKPHLGNMDRIAVLRRELDELQQDANEPNRDELEGFNIYLDDELYDHTNARNYTVIELQNGQEYSFAVSAVYENPDGESEIEGPVFVAPTASILPGFSQDFEDFNGALYSVPPRNGWEWGIPNVGAASGERAWGTLIDRVYPNNAEFYLYLPPLDLTEARRVWLHFNHYMDSEPGFDGGQIQVSLDDGVRWTPITPEGGYPEASVFALNGSPGFSGRGNEWEHISINISALARQRLLVRFVFKSDASRQYNGWFIDDLELLEPELGAIHVTVEDDAENPVEQALVEVGDLVSGYTNIQGEITFPNVAVGNYEISVSKLGFVTAVQDVEVVADEQANVLVFLELWDSPLITDPDEFIIDFDHGDQAEEPLMLFNNGFHDTPFRVYIDWFADRIEFFQTENPIVLPYRPHRDEPFDLIQEIDLTAATGEQFFTGVHFIMNGNPVQYRFVAGAGDQATGECGFYYFDRTGEFLNRVRQGDGRMEDWGVRDLAYDGTYLYGSLNNRIYSMNPNGGNVLGWFNGAPLAVNRAIAYIPEERAFWVGDWDDTWFKISTNGRILDSYIDHGLTGVTGMAWNPSDPDGFHLYVHNQESPEGGAALYRFNPETQQLVREVVTAEQDEGYAGGAFVTYLYDTQNYILGVLIQGEENDVLKLYELWPRNSWLSVEPVAGDIQADGEVELTVSFDASQVYDTTLTAAIDILAERTGEVRQVWCELNVADGRATLQGSVVLEGEGDVTLVNVSINNRNPIHPDAEGNFSFQRLIPGIYTVTAELFGFETFVSEPIPLEPNGEENIQIPLRPVQMGTAAGIVTRIVNGDPVLVPGVEIAAVRTDGEAYYQSAVSDEDGSFSLDLPVGIYRISAFLEGWERINQEGIQIINGELSEVNFVLDTRDGVNAMRTDGNFDDRITLYWSPPGIDYEPVELHYDDGLLADAIYLRNRDDIIAVRFEPEGEYDLVEIIMYMFRRGDMGLSSGWPNYNYDTFYMKVFAEDPETGLPGEMLFNELIDIHLDRFRDGWTPATTNGLRFREGPFYVGWSQDPNEGGFEAAGLDRTFDHPGTCFLRLDGVWRRFDALPGDNIIRAMIWSYIDEQVVELQPRPHDEHFSNQFIYVEDEPSIVLLEPGQPGLKLSEPRYNWREIFRQVRTPARDQLLGFMVYIDGEPAFEELLDANTFEWIDEIGSENENHEYIYSVGTVFDDEGELIEIEGVPEAGIANMQPGPVENVEIAVDGDNFTITWDAPQYNADLSEVVDYAGCNVFIDGDLAATVESPELEWEGSIEQGEEGWYDISLVCFDEVPNRSSALDLTIPIGTAEVNNFEPGNPTFFRREPAMDAWYWSRTMHNGPGSAHSGFYAWATNPTAGHYSDNANWFITTIPDFSVQTETAHMDFYHFMQTENGHDGGQVLISVDGGDWELIEPEGGYPDDRVAGLMNMPGFTGETGGWTLVTFDLAEYVGRSVQFRFRFGSDNSISWYPGWYIDDIVLWGCTVPNYSSLTGLVTDQDNNPISGAQVQVGRVLTTSNFNGSYFLSNLFPGEATVTAKKAAFSGASEVIELEPGEVNQLNLEIYDPEVTAEPEGFDFVLGGNDRFSVEMTLNNRSVIPIPYWIRLDATPDVWRDINARSMRRVDGRSPRRDEPWDIAFNYPVSQNTGFRRIMGAEYARGSFYLSSADPIHGAAILVLDWDGTLLDSYEQPVNVAGWGLRDLAWDGAMLYGSQDGNIYSFSPEGEAGAIQPGAPLDVNRALAYDYDADGFWAAEWESPWYLVNRQGEVQFQWAEHGLRGVYGFAYHPNDLEEMFLYVFNREQDGTTGIYRTNPQQGEIEQVHRVNAIPTGCFITGGWDADRWIVGGLFGGDDQSLTGFELNRRVGWISVEPYMGELEPRSEADFQISVSVPRDAEEGDRYNGSFSVRAFEGEILNVELSVGIIAGFRHFNAPPVSEFIHTIHVESIEIEGHNLAIGSEIAALTPRGDVGGVLRWMGEAGDLETYMADDGFEQGDRFSFVVWDVTSDEESMPEVEYVEGRQQFIVGGLTIVRLYIDRPDEQEVNLVQGWSLISTFIDPMEPAVSDVLEEVHDRDHLVLIKDGLGRFWWPVQNYNGLRDWDVLSGYLINVNTPEAVTVMGQRVPPDAPIGISEGWNMISYLLDREVDSRIALGGIIDQIVIAKNGEGMFMVPGVGYYGMGDMIPGQGYKIKVTEDVELVYQEGEQLAMTLPAGETTPLPPTGSDMSLLITDADNGWIDESTEIVVLSGDDARLVGIGSLSGIPAGIVVRGDDITTPVIDGALEGEELQIAVRTGSGEIHPITEIQSGQMRFSNDGLTIIGLGYEPAALPQDFVIDEIYPNPFNDYTTVRFGLPETGEVDAIVRDMNGRLIDKVASGRFETGWHSLQIDASGWTSGIFFIELTYQNKRIIGKMVLIR